ncbi:GroES-like protein [Russula earlei]|uniref:GroES-like protein n=1 Tax=Russula earlei TaxID=71964 RepID=A0ACC0U8Z6_9AGAM|nr:GroES-like protein [Russula earlei]
MTSSEQQVLWLSEKGGPFQIAYREIPRPGPGFVLVKIESCALNPVDEVSQRVGLFVDKYPHIAGNDGSGTVEEPKKGDRVFFQAEFKDHRGTFQQYVLVDVPLIAKIPDNLTFDQASTIPLGFTTAAIGLYEKKRDRGGAGLVAPWLEGGRGKYAGQAIYIPGGASSVGQYAIQLAKLSGFNPIITTASAKNEAYCREAGATHVIDYRTTPYTSVPAVVKEIAKGPVGVIYDPISTPESQKADWEILGPDGSLVLTLPFAIDEAKGSRWVVLTFGSVRQPGLSEALGREMYAALPGLLADGSIKPNKGYRPDLQRLAGGKVSGGKLVARPGETPA